jgi:hypothetical protein
VETAKPSWGKTALIFAVTGLLASAASIVTYPIFDLLQISYFSNFSIFVFIVAEVGLTWIILSFRFLSPFKRLFLMIWSVEIFWKVGAIFYLKNILYSLILNSIFSFPALFFRMASLLGLGLRGWQGAIVYLLLLIIFYYKNNFVWYLVGKFPLNINNIILFINFMDFLLLLVILWLALACTRHSLEKKGYPALSWREALKLRVAFADTFGAGWSKRFRALPRFEEIGAAPLWRESDPLGSLLDLARLQDDFKTAPSESVATLDHHS